MVISQNYFTVFLPSHSVTITDYSDTNYLFQVFVFPVKSWNSWYNAKDL